MDKYITVAGACVVLRVCSRTFSRMIGAGLFTTARRLPGRRKLYLKKAQFLKELERNLW